MTENHSKYKFIRPSRTEQINRPVTQNSIERWPENWEEKFCKLRNIWSHHTKLTNKKLRADSSREENISNKKKVFLEYLQQKKEKEQSSDPESSQHEEEEDEAKNKVESSEDTEVQSSVDETEEVEIIPQELSIRSTNLSPRLASGRSKHSDLNSKKSVKKCRFDEGQYIEDLKNLHSNIQTFLHLSSTYLDKSCCKKKTERPYVKKCYLEGYDGPLVVEPKKSRVKKTTSNASQLAFIKMPEHPVKGQLSKKQLEKLSLYNAPNIEIYGGRHKRFRKKRSNRATCHDVNCPFLEDSAGSKKSKRQNYSSYCDNQINLKLNNFNYEQICHQSLQQYHCNCCNCLHENQENYGEKKGFFKNILKKKPSKHSSSDEECSNSCRSRSSTKTRKVQYKSSEKRFEDLKSKQVSQKSIRSTKTNQSNHSETKSKKSAKSDKTCYENASKKSTTSSKHRPGILKDCCRIEEDTAKSIKIEETSKSKQIVNKQPSNENVTVVGSPSSKKDNIDIFCDSASNKSSKSRSQMVEQCCELNKRSSHSTHSKKSNKSVKKIVKKSSSGSYKSAKGINTNKKKCVCEGLRRGQNLIPVNPKELRKKKKRKKRVVTEVEMDDEDDEDSSGEMTFSKAAIFNDKATMFDLVKSPSFISSRCTSLLPKQAKNVCCENEELSKSLIRMQFLELCQKKINTALLQQKQSEKYPKITIKVRNKRYKNKNSSVHCKVFKKYTKDPNNLLQTPLLRSKIYRPTTDYLLFPVIRKKCGQKRVSFVKSKQKNIYYQY